MKKDFYQNKFKIVRLHNIFLKILVANSPILILKSLGIITNDLTNPKALEKTLEDVRYFFLVFN